MDPKLQIRQDMKALRSQLGAQERNRVDSLIAERVCSLPQFSQSSCVFTYCSTDLEVDTREIINRAWAAGKTVIAPRCVAGTREMEWHSIRSFHELTPSSYGIDEPEANASTLIDPRKARPNDIALVPALSFDETGYRIGYGGGYYDVFLPQFPGVSIGLCRNAQMSKSPLPIEDNDRPVSLIATENALFYC